MLKLVSLSFLMPLAEVPWQSHLMLCVPDNELAALCWSLAALEMVVNGSLLGLLWGIVILFSAGTSGE